MALELLERDVHHLDDRMLTRPTPCDGWTVRDLIHHMNLEHIAIGRGVVGEHNDPRAEFSTVANRRIAFFEPAVDRTVCVERMESEIPSEVVLSVHFADMVIHRWDLTTAIESPCPVPRRSHVPTPTRRVAPGSPALVSVVPPRRAADHALRRPRPPGRRRNRHSCTRIGTDRYERRRPGP